MLFISISSLSPRSSTTSSSSVRLPNTANISDTLMPLVSLPRQSIQVVVLQKQNPSDDYTLQRKFQALVIRTGVYVVSKRFENSKDHPEDIPVIDAAFATTLASIFSDRKSATRNRGSDVSRHLRVATSRSLWCRARSAPYRAIVRLPY